MNDLNKSQADKRPWEVPWTHEDLSESVENWSLAGNAGFLLSLKQFSNQITDSCLNLEKSLDQLIYNQKQCDTKLNNTTSDFLMLENTQFIENLVSEEEVTTSGVDKSEEKKEKTKEEKEADMFAKINESIQIGLSIMDKYFEKIDSKTIENNDDDEEYDDNDKEYENPEGLLILYELKDPYILRPLPYLIGSSQYIEDDSIGLRDTDDDEEEEAEDDEKIDDEDSDSDIDGNKQLVDDQVAAAQTGNIDVNKSVNIKEPKPNVEYETEDDDDNNDLFKPTTANKANNLFDTDSDESDDANSRQSESVDRNSPNVVDKGNSSNKPLDFAAELAKRFASKSIETKQPEQVRKPLVNEANTTGQSNIAKKTTTQRPKSLFDTDNDSDEDNDLFFRPKGKINTKLFDDSDDDDKNGSKKKELSETKRDDEKPTDDGYVKGPNRQTEPSLKAVQSAISSALQDQFKDKQPVLDDAQKRPGEAERLLDDDDDGDLFKPVVSNNPIKSDNKKQTGLFDDDDSGDDLFGSIKKSTNVQSPIENTTVVPPLDDGKPNVPMAIKQSAKSLFFDEDDNDDLFKSTKSSAKKIEIPAKKSLFDDDESDKSEGADGRLAIAKTTSTTVNPAKQSVKEPTNQTSVLESLNVQPLASNKIEKKMALFFESDDNDDDLFKKKPVAAVMEQQKDQSLQSPPAFAVLPSNLQQTSSSIRSDVAKSTGSTMLSSDDNDSSDDMDLFKTVTNKKGPLAPMLLSKANDSERLEPNTNVDSTTNVDNNPISTKSNASIENPIQSMQAGRAKLFKSSSSSDDDLFKTKPLSKPKTAPTTTTTDLPRSKPFDPLGSLVNAGPFVKSDSDDDLFSKPKDKATSEPKSVRQQLIASDPLVEQTKAKMVDSDDDDIDLFKAKTFPSNTDPMDGKPNDIIKPTSVGNPIVSGRETNQPIVDDPLSELAPKSLETQRKSILVMNKNTKSDNLFAELNTKLKKPQVTIRTPNDDSDGTPDSVATPNENKSTILADFKTDPFKAEPEIVLKPEEKTSVKNLRSSISINPANLLPGARPKLNRPSVVQVDNVAEVKLPVERPDVVVDDQKTKTVDKDYGIDVDLLFTDQILKNAQKDRIRVSQKKHAPSSQRKRIGLAERSSDDFFSAIDVIDTLAEAPVTNKAEKPVDVSKPDAVHKAKDEIDNTDLLSSDLAKSDPLANPNKSKGKKIEMVLDDDGDLFADVSLLTKTTKKEPKTSSKSKTKTLVKDDIFDDADIDIFTTANPVKKAPKKPIATNKNVFASQPDIDDLFADPFETKK